MIPVTSFSDAGSPTTAFTLSKFKNEERLKMTSERDHLHNQRLQMQNEMSSKKLALSETKNRQASRQQARTKIEELLATENSLAAEIEVYSLLSPHISPLTSFVCVESR